MDEEVDRYWNCEHGNKECGTVIEGRSIVTCLECWADVNADDKAGA